MGMGPFITKIVASEAVRDALVVAAIFLAVFFIAEPVVRDFAFEKAHEWIGPEEGRLEAVASIKLVGDSDGSAVSMLLTSQANEAEHGALMHLQITEYFYVRYYISIAMAAFLALLTAICFAFISRLGWADANQYLVSTFIALSAITTYFAAQPSLYQQPQNVDSNKHLYAGYKAIVNDINRYAAMSSANTKDQSDFAKEIDTRLSALRSLPVTFNSSAVGELQKSLQQAVTENAGEQKDHTKTSPDSHK